MNKPHISIPKPCHENWDAMHPREQGRHCDACDKTVIDFTDKSEKEIGEYFAEHAEKRICGHFRKSQLHEKPSRLHAYLLQLHASASHNIKRHALRAVVLFFIGMMMTMTGCSPKEIEPADAQLLGSVKKPVFKIRDSNDYTLDGEARVEYGSSTSLGVHPSAPLGVHPSVPLGVQESSGGAKSK
jgi:hypothetical protein